MLWTLQWYIFREMGKTFLLTAIGLTALIGLGGGVMNMVEAEQITADQLLRIMIMILPVAASLTLPVAALFSATVTYGRLSADNELVACRASGINIHHLLLPTLVFSLVPAAVTFYSVNYVIPGMVENLARVVKADAVRFARNRLQSPGRLALVKDRYRIYADTSEAVPGETANGVRTPDRLVLSGVAFVEASRSNWVRYGTAKTIDIRFDMGGERAVVEGDMYGLSLYDRRRQQWTDFDRDSIAPYEIDQTLPKRLAWRNLDELLYFRRRPAEIPEVRDRLDALRAGIACTAFFESVAQQWNDTGGKQVRLGSGPSSCTLASGEMKPDVEKALIVFSKTVTVREEADGRTRTLTAPEATLTVRRTRGGPGGESVLKLSGGVQIVGPANSGGPQNRPQVDLDPFPLPDAAAKEAESLSDRYLSDAKARSELAPGPWVRKLHGDFRNRLEQARRKIAALIHSRLAFSASVLVLVILGAALSIIFRGAHVLIAFGISFVPSIFVIVTIIMGRQLANNAGTAVAGILVMWGGIVLVGALNAVTLTRFVRR